MRRFIFCLMILGGLLVFAHGCHAHDDDIRERQPPTLAYLWSIGTFLFFARSRRQRPLVTTACPVQQAPSLPVVPNIPLRQHKRAG